jgi:anthranilate synthase component 1
MNIPPFCPKSYSIPLASLKPIDVAEFLDSAGISSTLWEQQPKLRQRQLLPHCGRYSYLCIDPTPIPVHEGSPFEELQRLYDSFADEANPTEFDSHFQGDPPPFTGGAVALMSYDAALYLEDIQGLSPHTSLPVALLLEVDIVLVWDLQELRCSLIVWSGRSEHYIKNLLQLLNDAVTSLARTTLPGEKLRASAQSAIRLGCDKEEFIKRVNRAKEYIYAGDIFQVVLGNSFTAATDLSAFEAYRTLVAANPSPYQFLIRGESFSVVGSSPEMMLCLHKNSDSIRELSMRLVAGTYPHDGLGTIPNLAADPKEHAEHVMLVDHVRNDIGRVANIGTVEVRDLCAVETYRDVHHLVSQVSGHLRDELSPVDALAATFPIATLTGTPKIRAMEIIAELEQAPRAFFGGAIMILGRNGFLEAGVVIRSMRIEPNLVTIDAGAGIVADSDPEREFHECFWKAEALLAILPNAETARSVDRSVSGAETMS